MYICVAASPDNSLIWLVCEDSFLELSQAFVKYLTGKYKNGFQLGSVGDNLDTNDVALLASVQT